MVETLKKQLREKDLVLTDIRLEALSSAHQLESLKDTVIKMRVSFLPLDFLIAFNLAQRVQNLITDSERTLLKFVLRTVVERTD